MVNSGNTWWDTLNKGLKNKDKIAFVLPGTGRYGGVRVTVIAANQLIRRGHRVRIFYGVGKRRFGEMARKVYATLRYSGTTDWLDDFLGEKFSFHDVSECDIYEDEVIIGVGISVSAKLARLGKAGQRKIQYIHGVAPWDLNTMEAALRLPYPKILVAHYLRPIVASYRGGEILAVIPNGIDTSEYYPTVSNDRKRGIGSIYSSHPAKDPDTLLSVIERLRREMPRHPILLFGGDRRPRQIRAGEYVRLPSVEKARSIYSNSKVWILASMSEGFPGPILEAMACGCAVVSTDCGGPRDIIRDGENGFLVKVGDVEQIYDRTKCLLNDEKLREKMVLNSLETVEMFNWNRSINLLEDAIARSYPAEGSMGYHCNSI